MLPVSQFEVDLGAIAANAQAARQLARGRDVLVAVKANAYGCGLVPVARYLEEHHLANWLGVALVSEAQQLRDAGISLPLLKLSLPMPDEIPAALAANLALVVADETIIRAVSAAAAAADTEAEVHLKVDTGMRRVGAEPSQTAALAELIRDLPNLRLGGICTHLAVSDVPDGTDFTHQQLARFAEVVAQVKAAVGEVGLVHAANSGALLSHDLTGQDLVRPGIMIYGSYPDAETPRPVELRPVVRWTARVAFVKQVKHGETVSYGRTWTAPRDTWVATVAIGYGDGYSRQLSNRGRMLIDGRSYPIAGRVCMDQTLIDLGPETPSVTAGDEVVLIGRSGEEEITVGEVAQHAGTIAYEITCLVTPRVQRSWIS